MSTPPPIPVIPLADAILCHSCNIVFQREESWNGSCPRCTGHATVKMTDYVPVVECEARLVEGEK